MSIKLRSVTKTKLNLEIKDGEFLMIKGEDTAKKTDLLNIISGIKNDHGTVTISGYDVSNMKRRERAEFYRRMVGSISKGFYLKPELSIFDNIALPGVFSNLPKNELKSRVSTIAKNLKISDILKLKPKQITRSQAEKVCIARTCFMNPKIILADEITDGIGQKNAEIIVSLLKNYSIGTSATVIISSNDELVEKFATRVVCFENGKILESKK
jgi:ABC-type lipoprotein export system ATPase subunit